MAECVCNRLLDDGEALIRADKQPTYESKAAPGYGTDEAKWQIAKLFFADGNLIKKAYANGDPGFVHVYDDRADVSMHYTLTGE